MSVQIGGIRTIAAARLAAKLISWQTTPHHWDSATLTSVLTYADDAWILPVAAERLLEGGSGVPEAARRRIRRRLHEEAALELAVRPEVERVLTACAGAGLNPVLIKGGGLAYTHYPAPHLRPRRDTDLMIRAADRDRVAAILERLGFAAETAVTGEHVVHQRQFVRRFAGGFACALDVHWRIANPRVFADALTYDALVADATPVPSLGPAARAAAPPHALLVAIVHRVAHHDDVLDLLWLYDMHLLLARMTSADFAGFSALVEAADLSALCGRTLAQVREWLDTPVSASVQRWIDDAAARPLPGAIAPFVGTPRHPIDVLAADWRALGSWRARAALLREHLLPPAEYMRQRYGVANPALLGFCYAWRIAAGMPRWVLRRKASAGAASHPAG